jgi:plasmid stabilization system protein ParE
VPSGTFAPSSTTSKSTPAKVAALPPIAANPGIGHLRKDIVPAELYFHYVGPYAVIYRRFDLPTQIIAIIHGARDLSVLLQNESD